MFFYFLYVLYINAYWQSAHILTESFVNSFWKFLLSILFD